MRQKQFQEQIKRRNVDYINNLPLQQIPINGKVYKGKVMGDIFIGKICINIYEEGLFNYNIVTIKAELEDNKLWVKRICDNHEGIVNRNQVEIPEWHDYYDTNQIL